MNVKILISNPYGRDKPVENEWHSGKLIGYRSGSAKEDFHRIDVVTNDGRNFIGCHPDCILIEEAK